MISFVHNAADVLVLVLLFGVTIFVHELCHFLVALRLGLVVETFSLGFGPALWQTRRNGIVYKIGWIPFGGYVALPQLDPASMDKIQGASRTGKGAGGAGGAEEARAPLPFVSPWRRIAVSVAGVIGNLVLGIVLAWVVYFSPEPAPVERAAVVGHVATDSAAYKAGLRPADCVLAINGKQVGSWHDFVVECAIQAGQTQSVQVLVRSANGRERTLDMPTSKGGMDESTVPGLTPYGLSVVGSVLPDGSAAAAGVRAGDTIISLDGVPVCGVEHFIELIAGRTDRATPLCVLRAGRKVELTVTPRLNAALGRAVIGVELSSGEIMALPWMRHRKPMDQIRGDAREIMRILKALVTPRESRQAAKALGGPIMIVTFLWLSIKVSIFNAVGFLRFLNINLAILNLLPFPVLDGGHILFALWEGITRRRIHPRVVNVLVNVFATLLIGTFLLLTFRDVRRLPRMFRGLRGGNEPAVATNNAALLPVTNNAAVAPAPR